MLRSDFIRSWRKDLALSLRDVADKTQISEVTLEQIELGSHDPTVDELEAISRALGLRAEYLYDADVKPGAAGDVLRVLFKSAEALSPPPYTRLEMLDAARAALDLLELHERLTVPRPALPKLNLPKVPGEPLHKLGRRQAKEVRSLLALGKKPVESLRDLITLHLRIPLIAARLGQSGPDAFTVFAPGGRVAIVLNVDGKHENLLVRRFTLAHELGHAISDKPAQGGSGFACLIDSQQQIDVETRANAFAIHMLLSGDVEKLGDKLLLPVSFRDVMETWGIHYRALYLYVKNLLGLTDEVMAKRVPNVDPTAPLHVRNREELEAERSPLKVVPLSRRGELARLVLQAHAKGQLSTGRARELLRVDATADLLAMTRSVGLG